jgi:hypothetical protein
VGEPLARRELCDSLTHNPQHYSHKLNHTNKSLGTGVMFWDASYDQSSVATASNGTTYFVTDGYRYEPNGVYRVDVTLNQSGKGSRQLTSNISWVLKYTPLLEEAFHRRKRSVGRSWRMD